MERFSKLLKDNLTTIMKILVSLFLCIVCSYWMGPETDYSLFVSMITGISIIAFIYEFLFTKKYKDALINILCAFSIFIATNHLYSTAHLIRFYNKINFSYFRIYKFSIRNSSASINTTSFRKCINGCCN